MEGSRGSRNGVTALAMVLGAGALLVLACQRGPEVLDGGTGLVPWWIPLVAAALAIGVAELGLAPDFASSPLAWPLVGALLLATGWAALPLAVDVQRLLGAGGVNWWGLALRLLLLGATAAALVPLATAVRARRR